MTTIPSVSLPLFALLLAGAGAAQSNSVGPYDAESFEAPRLQPGTLPGTGYADGQDGWMLLDSLAYPGNLAAAQVQTSVVRSGAQAVRWNAAQMTPGGNGELRRNAMFSLTTGVIEFEFDFQLASAQTPSQAWGFYTQPYPHPQSAQLWWEIRPTGEIWYCTTSNRNWFATGSFVSRDVWYHARTVVDIFGNRTALYLDGALAAQGQPVGVNFNAPDHGFAQFWCNGAGNDAFYIDNFTVRERIAPLGLSKDLPRLRVGQRSVLEFHLAGHQGVGNHAYALLGSLSGSSPGISLGSATLPLVPDAFLGILAGALGSPALPGFLGTLPPDGDAFARFDTQVPLPASMVGTTVTFAWFTYYPTVAVSEPVQVPITL